VCVAVGSTLHTRCGGIVLVFTSFQQAAGRLSSSLSHHTALIQPLLVGRGITGSACVIAFRRHLDLSSLNSFVRCRERGVGSGLLGGEPVTLR